MFKRDLGKNTDQKIDKSMFDSGEELLRTLRSSVVAESQKQRLYKFIKKLPSTWYEVTGESETISLSGVGAFSFDYTDRAAAEIKRKHNNKAFFEFMFMLGESNTECATFSVDAEAKIINQNIILSISGTDIDTSSPQWQRLFVIAIVNAVEN